MKTTDCPVCTGSLHETGPSYSVNELFEMWAPMKFSEETVREHFQQNEFTQLNKCNKCGLQIFLPPVIGSPGFYKELQNNTDNSYYEDTKWDFEQALSDVNEGQSIIEVGCGPGNFLEMARKLVKTVYGTEYNSEALLNARKKGLHVFGMDDDLIEIKGKLDAAFSFHVIEHVADPISFMRELISNVKPGGLVGISVPNSEGPIRYITPCIEDMPPHHATRWSLRTFESLANKLSLSVERVAFEPLSRRNHYYYSYYWVNSFFQSYPVLAGIMRGGARVTASLLFMALSLVNKKYINFLKGQAIYVAFRKKP